MIVVEGSERLAAAGKRLAGAPLSLRRKLRRNITVAARPIVAEIKQGYRGLPSKGGRSTGLRRSLARATRSRITTGGGAIGVSIRVEGSKMPAGQQSLPWYVEGFDAPWRHPVFGDREVWAAQDSHPVAGPVVRRHRPDVGAAVVSAAEQVAAEVTEGL